MNDVVLVTGGCGFIGANLIRHFLRAGRQVRVLDNGSIAGASSLGSLKVDFVAGDIRSQRDVTRALAGVSEVVHLAAFGSVINSIAEPEENFEVNAKGTFSLLFHCAKADLRRFVFASTAGALMGNTPPPVDENSVPAPISPYGASKLCGEAYCKAFASSHGLATVILRFANIYGPHSLHKKGAVTAFAKCLLADEPITIYGDGASSRDFLYVDDLCQGITRALTADLPGATVMHLAGGVETSVHELAEQMCAIAGKPDHPIHFASARRGEVERTFSSFNLAERLIGFRPAIRLDEGLRITYEWMRSAHH